MGRSVKYCVLFLLAVLPATPALSQTIQSETPKFMNWLMKDYLDSNGTAKLSRVKWSMSEYEFSGWTAGEVHEYMRKDDPPDPPGTFSLICASPTTYESSSLQFLKDQAPQVDTGFLLGQIPSGITHRVDRHPVYPGMKINYLPAAIDPNALLPFPLSYLIAPVRLFGPRASLVISDPVFTPDFKYAVVKIESGRRRRSQGTILIFKSANDQWILAKSIKENRIAQ